MEGNYHAVLQNDRRGEAVAGGAGGGGRWRY